MKISYLSLVFLLFLSHCHFVAQKATDNQMAKRALGKALFFDKRLSLNQTKSCASCHAQELAFSDGYRRSLGIYADIVPHNAPSLVNCVDNRYFNWANPKLQTLQQQIILPLTLENPTEMGVKNHEAEIYARLKTDNNYPSLFQKAFPHQKDPVDLQNIIAALAEYVGSLTAYNSQYDKFKSGDSTALSDMAKAGMKLFFSKKLGCATCHQGRNFTTNTKGCTEEVYYSVNDKLAVRVPSLRNVAITTPYLQDGSVETLKGVLERYQSGENKYHKIRALSKQETMQMLHFLESLTDTVIQK